MLVKDDVSLFIKSFKDDDKVIFFFLFLSQTKNILVCQKHYVFIDMYYLVC